MFLLAGFYVDHASRRARRAAHRPVRRALRPARHRPIDHRRPRLARLHAARPRHRRRRRTRRARHRLRTPGGPRASGFIAQLVALDHPSRVASLVLIGTRPFALGPVDDDLPEHSPAITAHSATHHRSTGPPARRSWTPQWTARVSPARLSSTPPRPALTPPASSRGRSSGGPDMARLVVPVVPVDSQYCGGGGASRTADTRSGRACVIGP